MKRTIYLALFAAWMPLAASAADVLTCNGTITNPDHDISDAVDLVPQPYDRLYLEGMIDGKIFGALTHDIAKNEMILLVAEPGANRTAMLTASFSKIEGTRVKYVAQQYVIKLADNTQTWLATSCYLQPPGAEAELAVAKAKVRKILEAKRAESEAALYLFKSRQ